MRHHHLCPGMTLDLVGYISGLGEHLVRMLLNHSFGKFHLVQVRQCSGSWSTSWNLADPVIGHIQMLTGVMIAVMQMSDEVHQSLHVASSTNV